MARSFRSPLLSLATLVLFAWTTSALHFYMDLKDKRCFIEELPTDTVVEGIHTACGTRLVVDSERTRTISRASMERGGTKV